MARMLDRIDRQILKVLQGNGRLSNVDLAAQVGITPPPSLRRVRSLEEAGYIEGYNARLSPQKLGYTVVAFAMVQLRSQSETDLRRFDDFAFSNEVVREAHQISGDIDYLLKCVAKDLRAFHDFVNLLTATPNVRHVRTMITLKPVKADAGLAVPGEV